MHVVPKERINVMMVGELKLHAFELLHPTACKPLFLLLKLRLLCNTVLIALHMRDMENTDVAFRSLSD